MTDLRVKFDPDAFRVEETRGPIRAPRGSTISCKGWQQEAALRMLMNNLDPEVAEHPEDLVVYGGRRRAGPPGGGGGARAAARRGRLRRERGAAAWPGGGRDRAGAVRQAGRGVPHPRVGAARADRELE